MNNPFHIVVDSMNQHMTVLDNLGKPVRQYPISTGKAGMGFKNGSGKTPWGKFHVCSKITSNQGIHTIFHSRIPCGSWPSTLPEGTTEETDFILTGILWLDGLDKENANTKERYVYIHGTHHTDLLGTPASKGCIRLSPENMSELLGMVNEGAYVEII